MTQPTNLLYCLIGVLIGMLIGVLPGLGPAATMAILLPIAYNANDPVSAIIMLAGIYYGAQYGGTITSVLLRIPGEASSVVTVFDGFALAKQGKAGTALGIAAIGSFVGATVSIIGLTLLGPIVAGYALDFGPPEYAALALLGVLLVATVGNGNTVKALVAAAVGLLLATVGSDSFTSANRFTFDTLQLQGGIDFVVVAMGLFGVGEILYNLEERHGKSHVPAAIANIWPSRKDLKQASPRHRPRLGHRLLPRRAARWRRRDGLAGGVRRGEACRQGPLPLRARCDRGRRRSGVGQQRRRHLVLHPAADDRHPGQRLDGDALRRAARRRRHARPAAHRRATPTSSGASSTRCTSAT